MMRQDASLPSLTVPVEMSGTAGTDRDASGEYERGHASSHGRKNLRASF